MTGNLQNYEHHCNFVIIDTTEKTNSTYSKTTNVTIHDYPDTCSHQNADSVKSEGFPAGDNTIIPASDIAQQSITDQAVVSDHASVGTLEEIDDIILQGSDADGASEVSTPELRPEAKLTDYVEEHHRPSTSVSIPICNNCLPL